MAQARKKSIRQGPPPEADALAPGKTRRWRTAGICLALAAITFAVFGQTTGFGFVNFDDDTYVYENPVVAGGLSMKGLVWVFTHADCLLYHPLTMLSLMADYQFHGLHPGGYHLTNVLLHTASVILLFLILRQMTGAFWRSAFVAAVFAIHPLRVESVAWVAERKDVLGTFFFMLTLGAYVHYVRKPNSLARYLTVAGTFVLALLSKPTVVTLPFVLLLLDYWPLRRAESARRLFLEKIPLLVLAAGACAVTVLAAEKGIATSANVPMLSRLANALLSYAVYLRQMVWPEGLAAFYPHPDKGYPAWTIAGSFLLLALITGGVLAFRRKRPWLLAGWLWYLGMLTPMIGIIKVGEFAHADRMTYLPQIGIYVALAWLVAEWRMSRLVFAGLMAGILAVLMFCARQQASYWKNSESLWLHTIACTTANDLAHHNLGYFYSHNGRMDEGIAQFQQTLQLKPDNVDALYDLGSALLQEGKIDEAIVQLLKAVQIQPAFPQAQFNLGKAFLREGKTDEAIARFQKVLQLKPDYAPACYNLGKTFLEAGKVDEAIAYYQKAFEISPRPDQPLLQPDYVEAHYNLGNALLQKGRMDEAVAHYQSALQLNPAYPDVHLNIGGILLQNGKADEAIAQFQQELQIAPASLQALNNLAWVLATCPNPALRNGHRAVELAGRANALAGGRSPIVFHILAAAYAEAGRFGEARESVQKAIELARAGGQQDLAAQLNEELKRYEAGLPLHE